MAAARGRAAWTEGPTERLAAGGVGERQVRAPRPTRWPEPAARKQPGSLRSRLTACAGSARQALMDLVLLSRCRVLVASVHSTFSYAAHALAGVEPWVVSARGPGGASRCVRAAGAEPCFHAWGAVRRQVQCLAGDEAGGRECWF